MPIIDSKTLRIVKDYSVEELVQKAKEMRVYNMISLCAAKSGHTGGTLSIMDVAAVLYLKVIKHDPTNPKWDNRDRVFWSVGHKAPALYVALGMAGYYPIEDTVKLRKLWSGFEGHPNQFKLPGLQKRVKNLSLDLTEFLFQVETGIRFVRHAATIISMLKLQVHMGEYQ